MSRERVVVNEVGPRDGLQNQPRTLEPASRVALVRALLDAGLRHIEAGSFVSPRAVPQMEGTDAVLAGFGPAERGCLSVLVPNAKGYALARAAGATRVALVLSATDTMSLRNLGMDRATVFEAARHLIDAARAEGVVVQAYVSVAFECPFEGPVDAGATETLCAELLEVGAHEVVIADTIGAASPAAVSAMMRRLVARHGAGALSVHFHDTRALALANCYAALAEGVRKFDGAIGGLGGCPFAPGASGNVATEDLVLMLESCGMDTGVDMGKLVAAGRLAADMTGNAPGPRCAAWLRRGDAA
jgi:hydroxymethylglutaryl-CoA lyase